MLSRQTGHVLFGEDFMATVTPFAATQQLAIVQNASRELERAQTIGEIKEIRDKAEAVRKYARRPSSWTRSQNHAAEVKLRASESRPLARKLKSSRRRSKIDQSRRVFET